MRWCSLLFVLLLPSGCAPRKYPLQASQAIESQMPEVGGNACALEPIGRGCRVLPFVGPCGTYLTVNHAELEDLQQSRYLNLRFKGDHRAFLGKPSLVPATAHRSLVDPGSSIMSLVLLVELLGGPKSVGISFPSEKIVQRVAEGPEYTASAQRLNPAVVELLANVTDLSSVSNQWDAATRAASPQITYHRNSSAECSALLSTIVDMAREARSSERAMYFVGSLAKYEPRCGDLGGCAGYGCDRPDPLQDDDTAFCHAPSDECLSSLDCRSENNCRYDTAAHRFVCRPIPPERLLPPAD